MTARLLRVMPLCAVVSRARGSATDWAGHCNRGCKATPAVLGANGEVREEHGFDGLMRKYSHDAAMRVVRVERPGERSRHSRSTCAQTTW